MRNKALLIFILILSAFLRLYRLGEVPISPDWDEVALGYNAYSIKLTGRDEYGELFPVILRSFDDYKPALYTYLIIPFIALFDLSVLAVRLPSVLAGITGVLAIYLLIKELFKDKLNKNSNNWLALFSAGFMALSPWHIQFSRVAFESNVGLTLNILFILFFLKGLKKPLYLSIASVFAVLSIYTYQSEKVFVPFLLLGLIIIYIKNLVSLPRRYLFFAISVLLILLVPMFYQIYSNPDSLSRAKGVSVFSNQTTILEKSTDRLNLAARNNDYLGLIFNNRRIIYAKIVIANYLSHFDPVWLFITGDNYNNRHQPPDMGLVYIFQLPLVLIGIYRLTFGNYNINAKLLIILWLLIAPVPASVTNEVPHAVRTLNMVPIIQILAGLGFLALMHAKIKFAQKLYELKFLVLILLTPFIVLNIAYYLNQYFIQQNHRHALDWQYGYKEMIDYIQSEKNNYEKIVVSNKGVMDQSYIFFLFYTKYDPNYYLKKGGSIKDVSNQNVISFDKYEFRVFDINREIDGDKKTLFVGSEVDFTSDLNTFYKVNYPNGKTAIKAASFN